jgi:transcriptional regulator of stress and heat shock response
MCLANLADDIERFLKQLIGDSGMAEVQRATLAAQFGCAPSQINYVLATRFTSERGYLVESRRGGGGYIRLIRLNLTEGDDLHELIHQQLSPQLSQAEALGYILRLREQNIISEREAAVMHAAIHRESIGLDLPLRDIVRANILKAMLFAILRY